MPNNADSNRSVNGQHDRSIDFKGIAAAALASARSLLPEWLPGGRFESREYVALNPTRNDRSLGSFKINWQTGEWSDFADPSAAKGGDLISLFAYTNNLGQGEAARQIAEKLGIAVRHGVAAQTETTPLIQPWGEDGPPVAPNEVRRHYYPKTGEPKLKVKIKRRNKEWLTCYRVIRDRTPIGWQWQKPKDYRDRPYFGTVRNNKLMFWPEGEKDADTLDRVGLPVFTFGGTGDGLPKSAKDYLAHLKGRLLVIVIDNDKSGSEHGHEKAKLAHAAGVARIRIFNPATVWPDCKEKGDISDWITEGGGTREKLLEIVETLSDWQPTPEDTDEPTNTGDTSHSWECPTALSWMIVGVNCHRSRSMCSHQAGKSGGRMPLTALAPASIMLLCRSLALLRA
jgi:putative DNA primase/helicase